jgi:acetyltransferase-like isoleucine patch superfamily enzyme
MFKAIFISLLLFLPTFISQPILKKLFSLHVVNSNISPLNYFNFKTAHIENTSIGHFNVFKVQHLNFTNSKVRSFNIIQLLWMIDLNGSFLGKGNKIYGFKSHDLLPEKQCIFKMGKKSELSGKHFFDVTNSITIGDNVVVGGFNSAFWTHGYDFKRNFKTGSIKIGNNVFIGSHSSITHAVEIGNNITIGTRSVITKSIVKSGFYAKFNKMIHISKKEKKS